jgi:hypothetical protein
LVCSQGPEAAPLPRRWARGKRGGTKKHRPRHLLG